MSLPSTFQGKLDQRMIQANSLVCVGLDPQITHLPSHIEQSRSGLTAFLIDLVHATAPFAAAFKPNLAFFTALGHDGLTILADVSAAIPSDIPVILDCKVGDVGDTARAYARSWFEVFDFDACTVNPYLGEDALAPFLDREGRGVIVICKTSNAGSGDFQDRQLESGQTLYQAVADRCADWEQRYPASVGLVVGATYPEQLADVRSRTGNQVILLPGVGAQGGDISGSVAVGLDDNGRGLICSASRSIMYAGTGGDFAEMAGLAAQTLRDAINACRMQVASQVQL